MAHKTDPRWQRSNTAVYNVAYHIIFCPKYRKRLIVGRVETRLIELVREKAAEIGVRIDTMETMPDHVHRFVKTDPTVSPADIVRRLKGYTSRVLRQEFSHLRRLPSLWTRSYYCESIGHISEATIRRYIEEQRNV